MNSRVGSRKNFVGRNHCTAALPLPARDERGEGRGEGLQQQRLLRFPLSLTPP